MNDLKAILRLFWVGIFIFTLNICNLYSQKVNTSPSELFDRNIDIGDRFLQIKYSRGIHYFKSGDNKFDFSQIEMNSFSFLTQLSPFYKFALGSTFSHGIYWSATNVSSEMFQGVETLIKLKSNASYFNFNVDLHYFINDFQYSFRPFVAISTGLGGFYTRTRSFNRKHHRFKNFDSFHSNRNLNLNLNLIGGIQLDLFENHLSTELSFGYRLSSRNNFNVPIENYSHENLGNPEAIYRQDVLNNSSYYFNITFLLNILSTSIE